MPPNESNGKIKIFMVTAKSKKILIVDDDEVMSKLLVGKLRSDGFSVLETNNGVDGLKLALAEHPDLILLDIILPKMDGLTMLEKLQKDSWGKQTSVIVFSNLEGNEKISEALKSGAYSFIIKTDFALEEVVVKIKEKLGVS